MFYGVLTTGILIEFCSTYPQGESSILPAFVTFMAAFSTLQAFPAFNYQGEVNFMCREVEDTPQCFPLLLNHPDFYGGGDSQDGWAVAIQLGALLGITAAVCGVMAFFFLALGSCFVLKPVRILIVMILQGVAALTALFSLIAGAANPCKGFDGCDQERGRLDVGGCFMLFSSFCYLAAAAVTVLFWLSQRKEMEALNPQETKRLVTTQPPVQPQEGVAVNKTVMPNGQTRVEREFVDENGQLVKEIVVEEATEVPLGSTTDEKARYRFGA